MEGKDEPPDLHKGAVVRPVFPECTRDLKEVVSQTWWYTSSIPALRRQRQADVYELKDSLVYRQ